MNRILECIPNFSEGRDKNVIGQIANAIAAVDGVKLLHVDSGYAANRTVITFAGEPDAVAEAAFRGAQKAAELIDMTKHTGEHPRFGALDVCPLVPISGITMEETIVLARKLGKRIGDELNVHVFSYANAAFKEERKDLAYCRAGGYEGLPAKLKSVEGKPDFGPVQFNAKSGASAVGARDILIAYNINLNTSSVKIANAIAAEIREKGKLVVTGSEANPVKTYIPGALKAVKAIGWYIEDFKCAQVSMNLTNFHLTPLHVVFEEVCQRAKAHGVEVTGSEIVGLVPMQCLVDAGKHFLEKENKPIAVPQRALLDAAIKGLGLNHLYPFNPQEKVIDLVLNSK